ncbi:hypothetical protein TPY_3693 [Sulfobacillus acidophilus TPY]|uniref:SipL SPOCS domain-containing protein n=1 Tax=Sulfobacillus acidophilus (strain ATCC 700253 / DSM 10332 / NAL) TaxID=679936 RepID=G8TTS5_SULAD|nr:hypothetical protein TPY_3693 [Sulfobacillus acidophilus TPY]AEW06834.1 hypothetical protein Sulac_3391 [Sulfobacillus acidophilus DSM 10332]
MSTGEETCQELCTAISTVITALIDADGVCDYPVSDIPIHDVVVTGCAIASVRTFRVSDDTILVTVEAVVEFNFNAIQPDGNAVTQHAECGTTIEFLLNLLPPLTFFDQPCTPELECQAVYAGFDPQIGAEEFIVTVTGTVSCPACESAVVNVKLCPVSSES